LTYFLVKTKPVPQYWQVDEVLLPAWQTNLAKFFSQNIKIQQVQAIGLSQKCILYLVKTHKRKNLTVEPIFFLVIGYF